MGRSDRFMAFGVRGGVRSVDERRAPAHMFAAVRDLGVAHPTEVAGAISLPGIGLARNLQDLQGLTPDMLAAGRAAAAEAAMRRDQREAAGRRPAGYLAMEQ